MRVFSLDEYMGRDHKVVTHIMFFECKTSDFEIDSRVVEFVVVKSIAEYAVDKKKSTSTSSTSSYIWSTHIAAPP